MPTLRQLYFSLSADVRPALLMFELSLWSRSENLPRAGKRACKYLQGFLHQAISIRAGCNTIGSVTLDKPLVLDCPRVMAMHCADGEYNGKWCKLAGPKCPQTYSRR